MQKDHSQYSIKKLNYLMVLPYYKQNVTREAQ